MHAEASYEGVRALCVFFNGYVAPVLQGRTELTPRQRAFESLLGRVRWLLASLRQLDHVMHVQSIVAAARTVFELGMDLALLHKDESGQAVERFHAFTQIERLGSAKKVVEFSSEQALFDPEPGWLTVQRDACRDAQRMAAMDQLVARLWGVKNGRPKWPKHWSNHDAKQRARILGTPWAQRYAYCYSRFSWHVHGGAVGLVGLKSELLHVFNAEAFVLAAEVTHDMLRLCGAELQLQTLVEDWSDRLAFLATVSALTLADLRLIAAGEPPRFRYLEQHEVESDTPP